MTKNTLREQALEELRLREEALRERADQLRGLRNALMFETHAPSYARFEQLARQTGAWGYQDYDDQYNRCRRLFDWICDSNEEVE